MKSEEFNRLVETQCNNLMALCQKKAAEYVGQDSDRLGNFKRSAQLLGCTPERALAGFMAKHIQALYDFVRDLESGKDRPLPQWEEKTGDIILYCILIKGLLVERYGGGEIKK